GSLIAALRTDPLFPVRLNAALHEVHALWFYQQAMWDSAAAHLIEALPQAKNRGEQARWEYLIAQLQERSNKREEAQQWFQKAIAHTTDPVMDIYARLNLIRLNKSGGDQYIDQNIAALVNMARKDKYEDYRDAIYFMAARMELERNNFDAASAYLLKGARYKSENANSGNSAYLQLADLSFAQKNYKQAASFYDSIRIENMPTEDAQRITERKAVLAKIVGPIHTVERQDSLQRIAALPEKERTDIIRKTVRQLRRQQGLKEEETTAIPISGPQRTAEENNLFGNTSSRGEWYFYNKTTRTSGAAAFQQVWGKRPNVDNWRRLSDVTAQLRNNANNTVNNTRGNPTLLPEAGPAIPTFDALLANLPLTAEQLQVSNDSIRTALYTLGSLYIDELEDYPSAITVFEELRRRFPQMDKEDEVLFHLYHGYNKLGNTAQAATIRNALTTKYPTSRYATILNTGKDPALDKPSTEVTKAYEEIYDLFIEGHFSEALIAKQQADSIYKTNYWSPQLLYIESVYFIQQRQDSTATALLTTLIQQNSGTPMAEKATRLKDVLSRRKEIEDELTRLQIERPEEEAVVKVPDVISPPAPKPVEPEKKEEPKKEEPKKEEPKKEEPKNEVVIKTEEPPKQKGDTTIRVQTKAPTIAKPDAKAVNDTIAKRQIVPKQSALYNYIAETPHLAVVVLNKVDVVYGNEARNAFNRYNREKYNTQPLNIQLTDFDTENKFLLIGDFIKAQAAADYVLKAKAVAGTEIFPWLKAEKYSFLIITPQNLEVLKANPDLNKYRTFIEAAAGVKF
ncbi:MAG: hypothetical protein ICV53_11120, partial [Flavisolibacter sp.]|nr:hypothetical protein [Flavisolibacter sp.]